jgi:hypothetical protein
MINLILLITLQIILISCIVHITELSIMYKTILSVMIIMSLVYNTLLYSKSKDNIIKTQYIISKYNYNNLTGSESYNDYMKTKKIYDYYSKLF